MQGRYQWAVLLFINILSAGLSGCTKLTQVAEPVNTITSEETFGTDATATSEIAGIYNDILTGHGASRGFGNGATTINAGMSADELHIYNGPSLYETNTLDPVSFDYNTLWGAPYFDIYMCNAAFEGLSGSKGVSAGTRNQLTGEAKFLRAFCYFYLVNYFGDVPLALTTAYTVTDTLHRAPQALVYQQMVADLQDAQKLLPNDYAISNGQKIRANRPAATALLARVYLYQKDWQDAEAMADSVIDSHQFSLVPSPDSVFLANSSEAILQWLTPNLYPYATQEGNGILPQPEADPIVPRFFLTDQLLAAFETGDRRKQDWVDTISNAGMVYYYPYKYKVYVGQLGNVTENYMVLRLAEQYLIRAEARAMLNTNLSGAIDDLNTIRARAGLPALASGLNQTQVLAAVMQERRIELFAEWGNRWFDLKRTGQAHNVVSVLPYKQPWPGDFQFLYPISANEIMNDVNLIQNPGYH